jgi:hypothetical protein
VVSIPYHHPHNVSAKIFFLKFEACFSQILPENGVTNQRLHYEERDDNAV